MIKHHGSLLGCTTDKDTENVLTNQSNVQDQKHLSQHHTLSDSDTAWTNVNFTNFMWSPSQGHDADKGECFQIR